MRKKPTLTELVRADISLKRLSYGQYLFLLICLGVAAIARLTERDPYLPVGVMFVGVSILGLIETSLIYEHRRADGQGLYLAVSYVVSLFIGITLLIG